MSDTKTPTDPVSPPPKRGFWGRLFFRGMLIGGIGGVFFLAFLVAITVPNLRREVAPPEISGPGQVERNRNASSTDPTSGTLSGTASDSTSGTHPLLNLDDYPHLSPTMRKMTQAWLDQCAETDKALDTITDPTQRAQAHEFLKDREKKIAALLSLPLKWENLTFSKAQEHQTQLRLFESYNSFCNALGLRYNFSWPQEQPGEGCPIPEFGAALEKEMYWSLIACSRMQFELRVHHHFWDVAAYTCIANTDVHHAAQICSLPSDHPEWIEINTWDEEVYCLRQNQGVRGWVGLAGRSYQHALDSVRGYQPDNPVLSVARGAGKLLTVPTIIIPGGQRWMKESYPQPSKDDTIEKDF